MKKLLSLVTLILLIFLCACSSKQDPVNKLEDLVEELQDESEDYSPKDWERLAQTYAEIEQDLQKYEYTDEELKEIGKLKAKCFRSFAKSSAKALKSTMHNFKMQLDGASEEIEDALDEFKDIFDEFNE